VLDEYPQDPLTVRQTTDELALFVLYPGGHKLNEAWTTMFVSARRITVADNS
jgi:hypothetical protein